MGNSSVDQTAHGDFYSTLTEVLEVVQRDYVRSVGTDHLIYSAIKGMLRSLDPHSGFYDPKEFARLKEEQRSRYCGVGAAVRPLTGEGGRVVVVEPPAAGSPAARHGMRAGDVITHIEGVPIDSLSFDEVVNRRLRGLPGTWVNLTVERPGVFNPLHFRIERDEIPIVTVPYAFEIRPGVGYIKIDHFSESTAIELKKKLADLNAGALSGLILDLRNNLGGLLSQAIDVADLFLARGKLVVSTRGRTQASARFYRAPSGEKSRVPLVVLMNRQSASASEVVAGALQDHDRALIVGETSFGKGLVQSVYSLGNNTGMALTTARYYTPSGRLIQRDYSGSSTEYYFGSRKAGDGKPHDIKQTDSGRKVLGGGGITPDVVEPTLEPNRFQAVVISKRVFFEYSRRLTSGQVPAGHEFKLPLPVEESGVRIEKDPKSLPRPEITTAVLEDFREFLRSRRIDFTENDIKENTSFIERHIKQEVYTYFFGRQEGFKIAVSADNQLNKALEVLPQARLLMSTGRIGPRVGLPGADRFR